MMFSVRLVGRVVVTGIDESEADAAPGVIEGYLDSTMDELLVLGASDPRIDLDLGDSTVEFHICVDAANPIGALSQASGLLRTAVHVAGGNTPDWPLPPHDAWRVELLGAHSDLVTEPNDEGVQQGSDLLPA